MEVRFVLWVSQWNHTGVHLSGPAPFKELQQIIVVSQPPTFHASRINLLRALRGDFAYLH